MEDDDATAMVSQTHADGALGTPFDLCSVSEESSTSNGEKKESRECGLGAEITLMAT